MEYVQFAEYHVHVLHVNQFWTNLGFLVFRKRNSHATNLSPTVLIVQLWDHITIETSFVQPGIYGAIDKYDTTTNGFYAIRFL